MPTFRRQASAGLGEGGQVGDVAPGARTDVTRPVSYLADAAAEDESYRPDPASNYRSGAVVIPDR